MFLLAWSVGVCHELSANCLHEVRSARGHADVSFIRTSCLYQAWTPIDFDAFWAIRCSPLSQHGWCFGLQVFSSSFFWYHYRNKGDCLSDTPCTKLQVVASQNFYFGSRPILPHKCLNCIVFPASVCCNAAGSRGCSDTTLSPSSSWTLLLLIVWLIYRLAANEQGAETAEYKQNQESEVSQSYLLPNSEWTRSFIKLKKKKVIRKGKKESATVNI